MKSIMHTIAEVVQAMQSMVLINASAGPRACSWVETQEAESKGFPDGIDG